MNAKPPIKTKANFKKTHMHLSHSSGPSGTELTMEHDECKVAFLL